MSKLKSTIQVPKGETVVTFTTPPYPICLLDIQIVDSGEQGDLLINPAIRKRDGSLQSLTEFGVSYIRTADIYSQPNSIMNRDLLCIPANSNIEIQVVEASRSFAVQLQYTPYIVQRESEV